MIKKILLIFLILVIGILGYAFFSFVKTVPIPTQPVRTEPATETPIKLSVPIDMILIEKNLHKMTVYHKGTAVKSYKIALGFSPSGHKEQVRDGKTPEGNYRIIYKNPHSRFHKSLKISYPSVQDKRIAKQKGVSPGGDIMIHGLAKPFELLGRTHSVRDWTLGCIAVSNEEIDELYEYTPVGTPVTIKP